MQKIDKELEEVENFASLKMYNITLIHQQFI